MCFRNRQGRGRGAETRIGIGVLKAQLEPSTYLAPDGPGRREYICVAPDKIPKAVLNEHCIGRRRYKSLPVTDE